MALSIPEIGLSGLRLGWRHPRAVVAWTLVGMAASVAQWILPAIVFNGPEPVVFGDQVAWSAWLRMVASQAFAVLLFSVGAAIQVSAVYRAVLRPAAGSFAWLRLGADELRVGVLLFLHVLLVAVVFLGGGIMTGRAAVTPGAVDQGTIFIGWLASMVVLIVFMTWWGVRASMLGPMLVHRGRLDWGLAWQVTRGRFGRLLGAFAIAWIITGVMLVGQVWLGSWVSDLVGTTGLSDLISAPSEAYDLTVPANRARLAEVLVASIASGLACAVGFAPAAFVYRDIAVPEDPAEAFA
jgi:hypothetical protein